jgi:hypothetical protein
MAKDKEELRVLFFEEVRVLFFPLEHSRTSEGIVAEGWSDYTSAKLCGVKYPRNAGIPGVEQRVAT